MDGRHVDERQSFKDCAEQVERELFITTERLNGYLSGVLSSLACDARGAGKRARNSKTLWYIIREGAPRLRAYYTLDDGVCWLVWLEIDSDWAASHLRADG
jgi:hypothetical protein